MAIKNGELPNANEVATELALSDTMLRLILDLDSNGIITFTRSDYDNVTWDAFVNDTYYDDGNSSNVQLNVTANLIALDVDNTNEVYAADFTGVARDGTYTASKAGGPTVTFDAANDEEDFAQSATGVSSGGNATLTHDTTYRDGAVIFKLDNMSANTDLSGGGTSSYLRVSAFGVNVTRTIDNAGGGYNADFDDETNTWAATSPSYIRISRTAGKTKTESSPDGSAWTTQTDTDTATIGTAVAPTCVLFYSNNVVSGSATASLQAWSINGLHSTGYFISNSVTAGANALTASTIWDVTAGGTGSSTTVDITADGTNYETGITEKSFNEFSNVGTSLNIKLNLNADTAEVESPYFTKYAYQWNEG